MNRLKSSKPLFILAIMIVAVFLSACELRSDRSAPVQLDGAPADGVQLDPAAVATADPNLILTLTPAAETAVTPEGQTVDPTAEGTTGETTDPATTTEGQTAEQGEAGTDDPTQPRQTTTHVVQAGDTMGQISVQYNVPLQDILAANGLTNPDTLDVGQELIIPGEDFVAPTPEPAETTTTTEETPSEPAAAAGEREHIVLRGENLYRIGLQYGFTVAELQAYNNLPNPDSLDVGQVIKIPPSE